MADLDPLPRCWPLARRPVRCRFTRTLIRGRQDAFLADVVQVLCDEVRELVRLGCTYIQLDAPHYPLLIDPGWRAFYEERGWPLERWLGYGIELDNAVIDAGRPATFGFHLCRDNQLSRWLVAGGYDAIAALVFGGVHADRLLLEYITPEAQRAKLALLVRAAGDFLPAPPAT